MRSDFSPAPEHAEPERIDPVTGEVVPAPTFKPVDVTDWTDEELERLEAADALTIETWEATTIPAPEPRKVTGLDGKTYTRPAPTAPRRTPLAPDAQRAAERLFDAAERMRSVLADDRLPQNREQVAALTRVHLSRTVEVCQDLLDLLTPTN